MKVTLTVNAQEWKEFQAEQEKEARLEAAHQASMERITTRAAWAFLLVGGPALVLGMIFNNKSAPDPAAGQEPSGHAVPCQQRGSPAPHRAP